MSGDIAQDATQALIDVAQEAARRLAQPTSTWKHSVTFKISSPKQIGNDLHIQVYTDDPPYFYLNEGTKIRRAVMSKNFIPKTQPRSFNAGIGQGRVVNRGRKAPVMPGIVEREWTSIASAEFETKLQSKIDKICASYKVGRVAGIAKAI